MLVSGQLKKSNMHIKNINEVKVGDELLIAWGGCKLVYAKVLKLPEGKYLTHKVSCFVSNPGNYHSPECETDVTKHNVIKYLRMDWKDCWLIKRD